MAVADNVIRILGRYSEGYRLAAQHGSGSGFILEHAYQNQPRGVGPIGRFLDRQFLHRGAWELVRERFAATKAAVLEEVTRRRQVGLPTGILDLASGTGCYLRELEREHGGDDLEIVCRERDAKLVMHARELAKAEGSQITFCVGDPTDAASYLSARDPDLMIASGLIPMLPRDDLVRHVLRLSFRHLAPGGCLLATTVFDARSGVSLWEMRRGVAPTPRSLDRVAGWLRATGFRDVVDRPFANGHAAVLLARKPVEL